MCVGEGESYNERVREGKRVRKNSHAVWRAVAWHGEALHGVPRRAVACMVWCGVAWRCVA